MINLQYSPFIRGTIVVSDYTHMAIMSPSNHEEGYVNHHGYHSINVQIKMVATIALRKDQHSESQGSSAALSKHSKKEKINFSNCDRHSARNFKSW